MNEKKVLIAEDDEDIQFVLEMGLEEYNVIKAVDGTSAYEKIKSEKPDLIILDIMMPGINGIELNEKIKKDADLKNIPVIIITGRPNMRDLLSSSGENSVSGFLEKPFTLEVLEKEIKRILGANA